MNNIYSNKFSRKVFLFNLEEDSLTPKASMKYWKSHFNGIKVNNYIYIFSDEFSEKYSCVSDMWFELPNVKVNQSSNYSLCSVNDYYIYIFGDMKLPQNNGKLIIFEVSTEALVIAQFSTQYSLYEIKLINLEKNTIILINVVQDTNPESEGYLFEYYSLKTLKNNVNRLVLDKINEFKQKLIIPFSNFNYTENFIYYYIGCLSDKWKRKQYNLNSFQVQSTCCCSPDLHTNKLGVPEAKNSVYSLDNELKIPIVEESNMKNISHSLLFNGKILQNCKSIDLGKNKLNSKGLSSTMKNVELGKQVLVLNNNSKFISNNKPPRVSLTTNKIIQNNITKIDSSCLKDNNIEIKPKMSYSKSKTDFSKKTHKCLVF